MPFSLSSFISTSPAGLFKFNPIMFAISNAQVIVDRVIGPIVSGIGNALFPRKGPPLFPTGGTYRKLTGGHEQAWTYQRLPGTMNVKLPAPYGTQRVNVFSARFQQAAFGQVIPMGRGVRRALFNRPRPIGPVAASDWFKPGSRYGR